MVPDLCAGGTLKNHGKCECDIEQQVGPDQRLRCQVNGAAAGWNEDSDILQQDREFGEQDHYTISDIAHHK